MQQNQLFDVYLYLINPLNPCADEPIPNISYPFYSETCMLVHPLTI